ncbi:MAG: hypothetical protein WAV15_00470 [Minisyncoccia bacterium]
MQGSKQQLRIHAQGSVVADGTLSDIVTKVLEGVGGTIAGTDVTTVIVYVEVDIPDGAPRKKLNPDIARLRKELGRNVTAIHF